MIDKIPPTAIKHAPAHIQDTNGLLYILKDHPVSLSPSPSTRYVSPQKLDKIAASVVWLFC